MTFRAGNAALLLTPFRPRRYDEFETSPPDLRIHLLMLQYTYATSTFTLLLKRFVDKDLSIQNWKSVNDERLISLSVKEVIPEKG